MSDAINQFSTDVNAKLDLLNNYISAVSGDVAFLKAKIAELDSGVLPPETQALLDALKERVSLATGRLQALDAETPAPEPAPPESEPE